MTKNFSLTQISLIFGWLESLGVLGIVKGVDKERWVWLRGRGCSQGAWPWGGKSFLFLQNFQNTNICNFDTFLKL